MVALTMLKMPISRGVIKAECGDGGDVFPTFLPKEVNNIKDPFARNLAQRIQRLPVQIGSSEKCIMSSCVKPIRPRETSPVVLLHCFDSSCLEWRCAYPLLEEAGLEVWAIDVLGWGFSDLESRPPCNAKTKRYHLYKLWKTHIKKAMVLVGPSLGGAVAIDFAANHPEAVKKLVLINPSVYTGLGMMTKLPTTLAYAVVSLLKSIPLRLYAKLLVFGQMPFTTSWDWMNVDRLHCLLPWWEYATVNYMLSGGYNVVNQIKQIKQKTLVISGERDNIVNCKFAMELHCELPNSILREIPDCGHIPHVQNPKAVARLITDFAVEPLASYRMPVTKPGSAQKGREKICIK